MKFIRTTWKQALLYELATRTVVAALLLPCLGFALRLALNTGERAALSDQEIAVFLLSPLGLASLILLGGFWVGVAFIEQAGLMTIGFAAIRGDSISWLGALRHVAQRLPAILLLGSHLLARVLLISAPFLVLAAAIFWLLLTDYDINYYLKEKPSEFVWAAGLIGALALPLVVILARKVVSWMWALPALLFEGLGPGAAIRKSVDSTREHRWRLLSWVVIWILSGTLLSIGVTWITGRLGSLLMPVVADSLPLLALSIGTIGLLTIVLNFLISLIAAALFALVIVRSYCIDSRPGKFRTIPVSEQPIGPEAAKNGKKADVVRLAGVGLAFGAAVFLTNLIISKVEADSDALIIAHRGASADAPENTMAAIREALDQGTDFVEIDVQETVDGKVVVFHDSDFMKTAGNPLKIWNATLDQARQIDIGSWFDPSFAAERVPTLAEVLEECRGRAKVNIELKYYGHEQMLAERVIEIVEQLEMEKEVVIMSLDFDKIVATRRLRPNWTYGFLKSVSLGDNREFDVNFLAINAATANRRVVRSIRSSGRDVYVWTVNDPLAMSSMLSRGVDGLITDHPGLARRVLQMRRGLSPAERLLISVGAEVGIFDPSDWLMKNEPLVEN